jgi:DNA-binding response OmpR family regulator
MTKRILLVDDERSIRESLDKILRAEKYEVVVAEDGPEALDKYGAERIDLLVLDLKNGGAAMEWLGGINPLLPIVIITGRSNQRAQAESAGADALMEKPLDVPLLLQTIRELSDEPIEHRAQRASNRADGFRRLPPENQQHREMLLKRFTTPGPASAAQASG